jgi:putative CocE/NonD family hydrolase
VTIGLVLATLPLRSAALGQERISSFGRYSGYSEASYDGWSRHSEYVPMADGVEIAVFYFIPTQAGREASEPLPVLLLYTRYLRILEVDGEIVTPVEEEAFYQELIRHGYVFAIANARGTGASFGVNNGPHAADTTADSWQIVEWLADQPWSDGHIGMLGHSNSGNNALLAATQAPPHLDAVYAEMSDPSIFDFAFRGGTFKEGFVKFLGTFTRWMDTGRLGLPAPVDADTDGSMRDAALAEHADNLWVDRFPKNIKYRDASITRPNGAVWSWEVASAIDDLDAIKTAGIPVYNRLGWYDTYTTQQAWAYANLKGAPQKMTIGPWAHQDGGGSPVRVNEALRWFDYWLKGIDNGIMDEKPVHYYLMRGNKTVPPLAELSVSLDEIDAEDGRRWRAERRWPPRKAKPKRFFLKAGPSGTVASANDGRLITKRPRESGAADSYTVDYSSTMGSFSRWMNGAGQKREDRPGTTFFDERSREDEKALTYTSKPFAKARAIVGYPVVHLWVTSTHKDGDFFVYLEEIDAAGNAHYVTEGAQRASYRALAEAPWENFGLPYHRSFKKDVRKRLPAEPVELVFDLLGTAIVIDAGHRIRISIAGADALNHALYPDRKGRKAPTISIYRGAEHGSYVELPMMKAK